VPKDPKRNIQNYQLQGGNLNEFEFQKNQGEMAEESGLPFEVESDNSNVSQTKRVARVTAEAHRKVEKRKKLGVVKAGDRKRIAAGKRSAKKVATKAAKKTAARAGMKKQANVKGKRQKPAANRKP
jgi:hypothetical protein